ncbi:hypothetical protein [Streptomyces sp. NBC_01602]|uniref:hypothetical protein n=1 Tax=Streptomyces sp. NBC_01602 TaxID=2975893 RepID=UPI00386CC819
MPGAEHLVLAVAVHQMVFWSSTRDLWMHLYDVTASAVKSVDPRLAVCRRRCRYTAAGSERVVRQT